MNKLFLLTILVGLFVAGYFQINKPVQPPQEYHPENAVIYPTETPTSNPLIITHPSVNATPNPPTGSRSTHFSLPVLHGDVIFNIINQYRSSKSLPFFNVSDELCGIANQRVDFLIADNEAAVKTSTIGHHTGFREQTANYSGAMSGENLYSNATSDQQVVTGWQHSPPHNELLLATTIQSVSITKACVATKVVSYGSVVVLEVGDK